MVCFLQIKFMGIGRPTPAEFFSVNPAGSKLCWIGTLKFDDKESSLIETRTGAS